MNIDVLKKAREYEDIEGSRIPAADRPAFHLTPTVGWMNDPNGFSYYKGEIHLFYQYHPYDINWGPMYWGHVKSSDFIKWERLPAALAPDQDYDCGGCFSGSAVELPDGRQMLLYTGVEPGEGESYRQTQCLAFGDGLNYEKYEHNPVIKADVLPEGSSEADFRDPKIWWDEKESQYMAVVGSCTEEGDGKVILFKSGNGTDWEYVTTLDASNHEYGKMWECPDFFELDGEEVLIISPMKMKAEKLGVTNGNNTIYIQGKFDRKTLEFARKCVVPMDYGLDFYAPQTLETPDGRRIMTAWMQAWESSKFHPEGAKWFGMMTLPRELRIQNGQLLQKPVRELEAYREEPVRYQKECLKGYRTYSGVEGRILDMTVNIRREESDPYRKFSINLAENEEYRTTVTYRPEEGTLCIDRTYSGFLYNIAMSRKAPVCEKNGELKLRIIMDRFSVEIFVNDGEKVMSSCIYTPQKADGISFDVEGTAVIDIEKYTLRV